MVLENYEKYVQEFLDEDFYSATDNENYESAIKEFQLRYSPEKIENMTIDEYIYGEVKGKSGFFYTLTRDTEIVGRVGNRPEFAGVYYSKDKKKVIKDPKSKKYGATVDEVFSTYKRRMIEIYNAAIAMDDETLQSIEFPPTFKYKMAAMYNPDSYFTVFSTRHLQNFLVEMKQDNSYRENFKHFDLIKELLNEKDNYLLTEKMSNHKYSRLLYYLFGKVKEDWSIQELGVVRKDKGEKKISNFDIQLPVVKDTNNNLIKAPEKNFDYSSNKRISQKDLENQLKEQKVRGAIAEEKVLEYEKERLKTIGLSNKIEDIKQVSKENAAAGYDILSFNEDGTKRYIEVKSTNSEQNTFYLSINELKFSEKDEFKEDYWIYFVRKTTNEFLIKEIRNPFLDGRRELLNIQPTDFKIDMKFG
ncbi:hypothetical protein UAY_02975 [Enterococcus moraviensis ATCC BAA-383]|uniref:Protein NO VEIN C-terminal domain-containing protein n=1 Tax=Enterococcus moraviensis ATCC BAA-383 TaxID=1158609 RepID=R2QJ15_9ENTE|nr:DUF3883 domain-containing protein [Enterococcus moraviensis]EOH96607.1 hypothetical protein UAY_02975 [Enterococcus moraviensis ATCC BAA-383]EOT66033.1 hypothetical protein I586_02302 [Enterococcus moraviensis ATCC BAA-383]OJG68197.1 hypothetical protein RV09_GL001444 [Enterococcus moraviensis]